VETSTYPGVITYQGQAYIDDWGIEGWAAAAAAGLGGGGGGGRRAQYQGGREPK